LIAINNFNQAGPVTRSKAKLKQVASEEPLKLAIFKIFLREYHVQLQSENESISLTDTYSDSDVSSDEEIIQKLGQPLSPKEGEDDRQDMNTDPFIEQSSFPFFDDLTPKEENEDPDITQDPLYAIDLKQFILAFVKALSQQNPQSFTVLSGLLPPLDMDVLKKIL